MDAKIGLEPVTVNNWKECAALRLAPDQESFLPGNLYSIAESQFYRDARSMAVYNEDHQLVGYALFGRDIFTQKWKVFRIMIDQFHQRQGYGTSTIREIIRQISKESSGDEVLICYQDNNFVARSLYTKLGFVEQEIDSTGKITASLKLNLAPQQSNSIKGIFWKNER